jgi:hypothetical protein
VRHDAAGELDAVPSISYCRSMVPEGCNSLQIAKTDARIRTVTPASEMQQNERRDARE